MPKGTCWAEATSNSEKIKPVFPAIIGLHLSEDISKLVSQAVYRKLKFHNNLLEAFRVVLKALLGLVIPNQYCKAIMKIYVVRLVSGQYFL